MRIQPLTALALLVLTALAGCADTADVQYADPYPEPEKGTAPNVKFSFSADQPYTNTAFFFEDQTTVGIGKVAERMWYFGDGSTSNEKSPVHGYDVAGIYTVRLDIRTDYGLNGTHEVSVVISDPPVIEQPEYVDPNPLTSSFVADVRDLKVLFEGAVANAEGQFVDFTWDFGDETTSKTIAPVHHYDSAGSWFVQFTVTTSDGRSSTSSQWVNTTYPDPTSGGEREEGRGERGHIEAGEYGSPAGPPLLADFTYSVEQLTVDFTSTVINDRGFSLTYYWDLGDDGATSTLAHPLHAYPEIEEYLVKLTVTSADGRSASVQKPVDVAPEPEPTPHALVALSDSGINPYHKLFYRPNAIHHPCTIFENFPCSVETLKLTVGEDDWQLAYDEDEEVWTDIVPGTWYWIPRTVFSAVYCDPSIPPGPGGPLMGITYGQCIMRGFSGNEMTTAIIQEGPDVNLIVGAFQESPLAFQAEAFPFDIFVPAQIPAGAEQNTVPPACPTDPDMLRTVPVYVKPVHESGNMGCFSRSPWVISVGGAYAGSQTSDLQTTGDYMDVVSYQCGPFTVFDDALAMDTSCIDANAAANEDQRSYAGRVAGALGQSLYDVRFESGYAGGYSGTWVDPGNGLMDPVLGITVADLRRGMECAATYTPADQYGSSKTVSLPMSQSDPWSSWGWGFYDGTRVTATVGYMLSDPGYPCGTTAAQETYMGDRYDTRKALYGENPPPVNP